MSEIKSLQVLTSHSGWSAIIPGDPGWAEALEKYSGGDPTVSVPPPPLATTLTISAISDRQMAQIMATKNIISEAEALAWVSSGTVPIAMDALVNGLPEGDRFAARMLLAGATTFERSHPLVAVLGASYGMSSGEIDDLFRAAALL